MTEKEKMNQGLWYDANFDRDLLKERLEAENLCFEYNNIMPKYQKQKKAVLKKLIGHLGKDVTVISPFYADYGYRISIGDGSFLNHNVYLMDGGTITIGRNVFIGPNCGFYTANHPLNYEQRNNGLEQALPIVIEDNVWIGGDVTVLPGVTIGEGSVIGAKSLVTKDIPANSLAFGNPCRIIRKIDQTERISNKEKNL